MRGKYSQDIKQRMAYLWKGKEAVGGIYIIPFLFITYDVEPKQLEANCYCLHVIYYASLDFNLGNKREKLKFYVRMDLKVCVH